MSMPPPRAAVSPTSDKRSPYDTLFGCPNGWPVTTMSQVGKEVGLTTYSTTFPEKLNVELDRTAPTSACAKTEVRLCSRAVTTGPAVTYSALVSPLNGTPTAQIEG